MKELRCIYWLLCVSDCVMCRPIRLDQTLGKPGLWTGQSDKEKQKVTVMSGLSHIENKVHER
jgi:hypothetical protein